MSSRWRRRPTPRPTDVVYVAIKPDCRCIVDAIAADFMARRRLRAAVNQWFANGLWIARMEAREAAVRLQQCQHQPPAPDHAQLDLV